MRVDPVREIVLPRLNRVRKSGAGFMASDPCRPTEVGNRMSRVSMLMNRVIDADPS